MAPTTDASALVHEARWRTRARSHEGTIHKSSGRQLRDVTDAIRVGTPNELRKDVYFHLMDGSWWRVFGVLGVSYLAVNAVFAALFLIEPESIGGMEPSFLDAFAFSVQTMSTIGYGGMSPETSYGHVLVTIEAAIGLLYVALGTGVILAKIARPHSSVLFSGPVCITTRHGVPTLMFRAGNARGNEVVEASINVTVLVDEVSPEGHRMRVLHDLRLRRNTSPLFTLSWSVIHTIDEDSPLAGITPENIDDRLVSMIVTMQGYDATYAQNTHARHLYVPEDFHFGHKFVDVISNLDDGRFRVDFTKFHRVLPDGLPAPDTSVATPHEHASTQAPGEPLDTELDEDSAEASEVEAEFDNAVADAADSDES